MHFLEHSGSLMAYCEQRLMYS